MYRLDLAFDHPFLDLNEWTTERNIAIMLHTYFTRAEGIPRQAA